MFDELIETAEGAHADNGQPRAEVAEAAPEMTGAEIFSKAKEAYMNAVVERIMDIKTDPNIDLEDIDLRFSTALRQNWVSQKVVCLIGVGGIGNWVWKIIAGMGFEKLILIDDDVVEIQNVGPQAHNLVDLGIPKVLAAEQAMLAYRGVQIRTIQARISGYGHLKALCGGVPDILITGVDNMQLRNALNNTFKHLVREGDDALPELYIDMRMSLGDWRVYAMPLRTLAGSSRGRDLYVSRFYEGGAVFEQNQSVQEACTERAIVYTGANIAAYAGAVLHWYANEGRILFMSGTEERPSAETNLADFMSNSVDWPYEFSLDKAFSARDWEPITPTQAQKRLQARVTRLQDENATVSMELDSQKRLYEALASEFDALRQAYATAIASRPTANVEPDSEPQPIPEPEPAPACVRSTRPAQSRININFDDIDLGSVVVFPDSQVYITDITATYIIGTCLATRERERMTNRVVASAVAYHDSYNAYEQSDDFVPGGWAPGDEVVEDMDENPDRQEPYEGQEIEDMPAPEPVRPPDIDLTTEIERLFNQGRRTPRVGLIAPPRVVLEDEISDDDVPY